MNITTKADINNTICFLKDNKVQTAIVKHIQIDVVEEVTPFGTNSKVVMAYHTNKSEKIYEQHAFLTKQELLDSL